MALGKQLPIRLGSHTEQRLEDAAQKAGTTKSAVIRLLAQTFVEQVVKAGQVILPPNWKDLLPRADERSAVSRRDATFKHAVSLNEDAASESVIEPRREVKYEKPKRKRKP